MKRDDDVLELPEREQHETDDTGGEDGLAEGAVLLLRHGRQRAAAAAGDQLAKAELALVSARRKEEDAQGALRAAETSEEQLREEGARQARIVAAEEKTARAARAVDAAAEARAGAEFRVEQERVRARTLPPGAEAATDTVEGQQAPPAPLRYGSVAQFVERFVLPNWRHDLADRESYAWCHRWFAHSEAVLVLEAMWESFEAMRQEGGQSAWLRDHLYPHMAQLTRSDGVFHRCGRGHADELFHEVAPIWEHEPAPAAQFTHLPCLEDELERQRSAGLQEAT